MSNVHIPKYPLVTTTTAEVNSAKLKLIEFFFIKYNDMDECK